MADKNGGGKRWPDIVFDRRCSRLREFVPQGQPAGGSLLFGFVLRDDIRHFNVTPTRVIGPGLSATRKLSRNGAVGSLSSTLALRCGLFIQFRRPERLPRFHGAGICGPSSSSCCSFLSSPTR